MSTSFASDGVFDAVKATQLTKDYLFAGIVHVLTPYYCLILIIDILSCRHKSIFVPIFTASPPADLLIL